jgi:hypothetical protein
MVNTVRRIVLLAQASTCVACGTAEPATLCGAPGCTDAFVATFSPRLPESSYSLEIETPAGQSSCTATFSSSASGMLECNGEETVEFSQQFISILGNPETVVIHLVDQESGEQVDYSFDPQYTLEDRPPECDQCTSYKVEIAPGNLSPGD